MRNNLPPATAKATAKASVGRQSHEEQPAAGDCVSSPPMPVVAHGTNVPRSPVGNLAVPADTKKARRVSADSPGFVVSRKLIHGNDFASVMGDHGPINGLVDAGTDRPHAAVEKRHG